MGIFDMFGPRQLNLEEKRNEDLHHIMFGLQKQITELRFEYISHLENEHNVIIKTKGA